ncbi:hypothetical protein SAMN05444340_11725 [Citreimonas salinaria]|uniref:Nuclease homologue n=2 Tax=Citreimonas salinaria TaxID=321339 RepID=A0A1H3MH17_9RHOB|nr:hypothetical protein SAMN05444340_11725 [Citreimonas salinaria]
MSCLAVLAVTAAMIIDGDTVRLSGSNARLTGEGNAPFDTPETWKPQCRSEAKLGAQATGYVRSMMPGQLCIIGRGAGGYGRDLAVLYGSDGRDIREGLMERGLAKASKNANWCR